MGPSDNGFEYMLPTQPRFAAEAKEPVSKDEIDYSTLKRVQYLLDRALYDLKHDFNAFSLLGESDPDVLGRNHVVEIYARQMTSRYLTGFKLAVDSAIAKTEEKHPKK